LAASAGYMVAHRLEKPASGDALRLEGQVTHIRDGDTIEVSGVPVRIANLDCAERGTAAGDSATALVRQMASRAMASCALEGRRSYDREVGVCSIPGFGDVGEAMISTGACARW
jgi:endonuclease YncB( thermonuclease family)